MAEESSPGEEPTPDPTVADEAEAEFLEVLAYYARQRAGLGLAFLAAVERTIARAGEAPLAGAPLGGGIRRRFVPGFPYQVIYRADADPVRVLAIAHLRRRPGYWRGRR